MLVKLSAFHFCTLLVVMLASQATEGANVNADSISDGITPGLDAPVAITATDHANNLEESRISWISKIIARTKLAVRVEDKFKAQELHKNMQDDLFASRKFKKWIHDLGPISDEDFKAIWYVLAHHYKKDTNLVKAIIESTAFEMSSNVVYDLLHAQVAKWIKQKSFLGKVEQVSKICSIDDMGVLLADLLTYGKKDSRSRAKAMTLFDNIIDRKGSQYKSLPPEKIVGILMANKMQKNQA